MHRTVWSLGPRTSHLSLFQSHFPPHSIVGGDSSHKEVVKQLSGKVLVLGREGGREEGRTGEGPSNGGKVGEGSLVGPRWKNLAFSLCLAKTFRKRSNDGGEDKSLGLVSKEKLKHFLGNQRRVGGEKQIGTFLVSFWNIVLPSSFGQSVKTLGAGIANTKDHWSTLRRKDRVISLLC